MSCKFFKYHRDIPSSQIDALLKSLPVETLINRLIIKKKKLQYIEPSELTFKTEFSSINCSKGFSAFSYMTTSGIQTKSYVALIEMLSTPPNYEGDQLITKKK